MIFGGLITGPLINSFGRRLACVLGIALVFSVSYSLWLVASHVIMLYIARWQGKLWQILLSHLQLVRGTKSSISVDQVLKLNN